MKEMKPILPSPTLVIGLGGFAGNLLPQVRTLFLQSDPRRPTMAGFFRAVTNGEGSDGIKLEVVDGETDREPLNLHAVFHELRLHEKYLQVGLGDEHDLPLGVIVLVDLAEDGSEALYSLLDELSQKMTDEPGGYVYLLCKTATFETDPMQMQARLHLHRRKLESVAGDWKFQVYLFDGLKEGSLEVKDEHEIGLLMQNFLLALLSGRLAQSLAREYSLAAGDQGKVYYHSAGATALIYDPSALQEACAVRLGAEAIELEFLTEHPPDPRQIESTVETITDGIGDESAWAEKLCDGTQYRIKSDNPIRLDLHLSDIQFEGLPPQEWGDAIVGYADYFEKDQKTRYPELLGANSVNLTPVVVETLEKPLKALPASSALYPGGIAASLQVIQEMAKVIYQRIQTCMPAQNEEETAAILDGDYQSAIERLDDAISALPDPPRWMKRLPGKLYPYAKMLFEFLFLRNEYGELVQLREEIVRALESKFIFQFEQELRRHLVELCNQLISSLEKAQSDLKTLRSKFQNLRERLEKQNSFVFDELSPFRANLVTPALLEWVYVRKEKDSAGTRAELLEEGYLADWRGVPEEDLYQNLLRACRDVFQFVYDFEVEEVYKHVDLDEFSATLASLSQGAAPALRPDFDRAGEISSYPSSYFLCADARESEIADLLGASARTWQAITTGDPWLILFCRVRQMIPVNALLCLTRPAQTAFESLSEEEKNELRKVIEGEP